MRDMQNLAGELLIELEKLGVTFELTEEKLKYKDSQGNFSVDYKEKVKIYKNEIIEILKKERRAEKFLANGKTGITEYPLTEVQAAYLIGKTEAVKWGGIGCKGYIEVNFGAHTIEELSSAWELLVKRHEMLRAKVSENGFEIVERERIKYEIEVLDLRQVLKEDKEIALSKLRNKFNAYVFDTQNPPLFKVVITRQAEGNFFHLLIDLIISDFASVQLLVSEMGKILKGIPLKAVKTKFSNYALYNQQRKGSLKWYRDRAYWLKRLEELPEGPILPRDGRAASDCEDSHEFYRFQKHIDKMAWERIKEVAGEYGVTISAVLIGVYAEVIARWCVDKYFTLNLPIQNRPSVVEDVNTIVGDFTTVNLLAVDITQNISFVDRVKEITRQLMDDLEHNSFSGVEVLRELGKKNENKELLMPIVFTGVLQSKNDVGAIEYGFSHTPQVWIDCQAVDESEVTDMTKGLMISWDCRKGAVKKSIVTEMFDTFIETVKFLGTKEASDWKRRLDVVVPELNTKRVSCEQIKMVAERPFIQQGFIEYARKNPGKVAVIDAFEKVTYGELLKRAKHIAGYLREKFGRSNEELIAIRMKKSAGQIAAVMGVLIAGFAYLPIDIKQPSARQEKILVRSGAIAELNEKIVTKILATSEYHLEEKLEYRNPTAYVIFTSGSTGEPKGVKMSHAAVQNTLLALKDMYSVGEGDIVLGIAELSFDLSVFDIFGVLGFGGTLVLPNPEKGPDASHWGELINEYSVTLWNTVPAQAEMLDAFAAKIGVYPSVRLVMLSGDRINTTLPGRLRKIMPNAKMISLGGATEGGIWSIYHEIGEIEEKPTILYGKALPGQWMGVVDEDLQVCPQYVPGQIIIGGYSLADGYLSDNKLTEEKFIYIDGGKSRIYLTGDNGRYVENDDIEFLGRLDNQVKINGHRIEIAEIESVIRTMSNIEDCCVIYEQNMGKGILIAFVRNNMSSPFYTKEEYREYLNAYLPSEMIPSKFINVEKFPLSTNGKINRKALADSIQLDAKEGHEIEAIFEREKGKYVELANKIKKIIYSVSGENGLSYEDNLLENGFDSLVLSQISGRIVSDVQEAQGMRFDEILRISLTRPTIMAIAQYIYDSKNISNNQTYSDVKKQMRNYHNAVYIIGDDGNGISNTLIKKLNTLDISCQKVEHQDILKKCNDDSEVKNKYIVAFSEMAFLSIARASELLGENIVVNRIFLINPPEAKENDLYLGDVCIIGGDPISVMSWEKVVLGEIKEYELNNNDISDIIVRELENDR